MDYKVRFEGKVVGQAEDLPDAVVIAGTVAQLVAAATGYGQNLPVVEVVQIVGDDDPQPKVLAQIGVPG
jgi:hypothetical protein